MADSSTRTTRVLVDLQACQTAVSGLRGVGRFSLNLFLGMTARRDKREIHALLSEDLPIEPDLGSLSPQFVARVPRLPDWSTPRAFQGGEQDSLDSLALSAFIAPLQADVVHVSHVFEGLGERVALPGLRRRAGQILSATLHDLIPMLFPDHYLADPVVRNWYQGRLSWLRQTDLLIANSESSRRDAIDLLGLEPHRIVTVYGGVSELFRRLPDVEAARRDLAHRYGLRKRFVLYGGGDDYRKNLRGAIAGYARVAPETRRDCQLVIVCAMEDARKSFYLAEAARCGLGSGDIVLPGFVPEQDLVAFYSCCDLFIFPSLYEGFGLPVLEAMACGAPVIGGNNSSVRDLIAREDALFNAASDDAIGEAIARSLAAPDFLADLRRYGERRAGKFSWERSADLALAAFDEALARRQSAGVESAANGWLPRRRLAFFSPLPPARSGIADYSAAFLPHLSRHFDLDLYVAGDASCSTDVQSAYRVFDARDFEAAAGAYDGVVYEFGNSEFHAHMLPLLERHPGVVGLHDAYLSGLFGYREFEMGQPESYSREMLACHGPQARAIFAPCKGNPNPVGDSMVSLPCTKTVLDRAIGVISHSPFNLALAREHYPQGWAAPYRIIPQMVPIPRPWPAETRESARVALGYGVGDVVVASFGHITWTKLGDRLLQAFLQAAGSFKALHLVFVGGLPADPFGRQLENAIEAAALGNRVRVTGFLSAEDYERYLHIVDVAVQLRTHSRGGTPKGVLDCLARGIPVIVNNDGSYTDYPDNVVRKIESDPSVATIAAAVLELATVPARRASFAAAGRRYVGEVHDPASCASRYAAAIHEFIERRDAETPRRLAEDFAPHLAGCADPDSAGRRAAEWVAAVPPRRFERRRVIVDVSHIAATDHETGIQRVVREIVRHWYCSSRPGFEAVAVELSEGRLRVARGWLEKQGLLLRHELSETPGPIDFREGDVLVMLDSSWERYSEFFPLFDEARRARVPVWTAIYDLLPIRLPPGNFVPGGKEWFEAWFRKAIRSSDALVCISRAVADDVEQYLDEAAQTDRRPKVRHWHLGADFSAAGQPQPLRPEVAAMGQRPYLLMVGTIEPRKSHALALDAFEQVWESGSDLCLCIAGKAGWMVENVMQRLRGHPEAGRRLFLFEGAPDSEVAALYAGALGMLFLSKGEGFGLPLVEAANHGIPIVCSDIPVFREIAGGFASYVRTADGGQLAADLADWYAQRRRGAVPTTEGMPRLTWAQSANALLDVLGL